MAIVSNLKRLMQQKGMTYEVLQGFAQVSPETIARAGDTRIVTCTLGILEKIALTLDVSVKDLFDDTRHPASSLESSEENQAERQEN